MARKKTIAPTAPLQATGDAVLLPVKASRPQVDAGIARPLYRGSRRVTASIAASADTRFPKGAGAFAIWCKGQGIPLTERRTAEEWDSLLTLFADRPIHGHRRGEHGGSHKQGRR